MLNHCARHKILSKVTAHQYSRTFTARISNGVEKHKIYKSGTAERTFWQRRQSVNQSEVTVLANQWSLLDNRCRCVYTDIRENVGVRRGHFPWPAVNAGYFLTKHTMRIPYGHHQLYFQNFSIKDDKDRKNKTKLESSSSSSSKNICSAPITL